MSKIIPKASSGKPEGASSLSDGTSEKKVAKVKEKVTQKMLVDRAIDQLTSQFDDGMAFLLKVKKLIDEKYEDPPEPTEEEKKKKAEEEKKKAEAEKKRLEEAKKKGKKVDKKPKQKPAPKPKLQKKEQMWEKFKGLINSFVPERKILEQRTIRIFDSKEELLVRIDDYKDFSELREQIKLLKNESALKFKDQSISKELLLYLVEICKERPAKHRIKLCFYNCELPKDMMAMLEEMMKKKKIAYSVE